QKLYKIDTVCFENASNNIGGIQMDKGLRRVLIASVVGSAVEWFDYFIYGTVAALVFNQLFFVTDDPAFGTLYAFSTFVLAFFISYLCGVIFFLIVIMMGK